jgi:hypothetical protein
MVEFHRGLVDVIRLLLRLRLGEGEGGQGFREDLRGPFREKADAFSPGDLVRMLAQATELEASGSLRRSAHPRLLIEMLLLRLSYLDRTVHLETLLRTLGGEESLAEQALPDSGPRDRVEVPVSRGDRGESASASASLADAWDRVLGNPKNLPKGVLPFLRAATVEFPGEGEIRLSVLPGPGLERLQDPLVTRTLGEALAVHTGSAPDVIILANASGEGRTGRITEETLRDGRLRELLEKEPALGEAVEELDLELLD